jgi:hypothetical protein
MKPPELSTTSRSSERRTLADDDEVVGVYEASPL